MQDATTKTSTPEFWSIAKAQKFSGVCRSTFKLWVKIGKFPLPCHVELDKNGEPRLYLWDRDQCLAWREKTMREGSVAAALFLQSPPEQYSQKKRSVARRSA